MFIDKSVWGRLLDYQRPICEISKPLLSNTDVDFFCHERQYQNDYGFFLATIPEVNKEVIENNAMMSYRHTLKLIQDKNHTNYLNNVFFYCLEEDNKGSQNIVKNHGFKNTFVIVDQQQDYLDGFSFSSESNSDFIRDCFQYISLLIKFKNFYLHHANNLIKRSEKDNILPLCKNSNNFIEIDCCMPFNAEKLDKELNNKYYFLSHNKQRIRITKRELECLKYLSQGKTMKESGKILGLSPKTIEFYIYNLKNRLDIYQNSELVDIYLSSDLVLL